MKKIVFKDDVLPHLIAVIVFLLVTVVFYSPEIFEGKSISQHDVLQGQGGGQEIKAFRESTGEEPLWTNSMFGGMPAYLISVSWSDKMLLFIQNLVTFWLPSSSGVTMLSMVCCYIMLIVFGVRPYLAIGGAIAFAFTSFSIISIQAGHIWKIRAIAYMPLVLAGVHLLFQSKNKFLGFSLTALAIALEIRANHLQITYYLFLMLLFYGVAFLVYSIKNKEFPNLIKSILWVVLAAFIGISSNLGRLWGTYEYGQYSTRGKSELTTSKTASSSGLDKDYVFRWSSGKAESFTFIIPNLYGGASSELIVNDPDSKTIKALRRANNPQVAQQLAQYSSGYWGDQPGTSPIYVGAIVCFLFILGIVTVDKRLSIWLIAATVFALMLSWGKNFDSFNYLMFDYFPGYNKFRAVTMVVCVAILSMTLLGFMGLEKAFQAQWNKEFQKKLLIALGISAGFCLLMIIAAGMFSFQRSIESQLPKWFLNALTADRQSLMRSDAFRSLIFILFSAGAILSVVKNWLKPQLACFILIILVAFDLITVDKRYLNKTHFQKNPKRAYFAMSEADMEIKKDTDETYRVLNLLNPWNDAKTSYHHHSIGGYHGAKTKRYQQLIDYCLGENVNSAIQNLREGDMVSNSGFSTLNMLNTKYYIFGSQKNAVLPNSGAAGHAWFASEIQKVEDADEEIVATCALDNTQKAIIDVSKFKISDGFTSTEGAIRLTGYKPNHLQYEATSSDGGLAVFSEIYYPKGWKAYVDGEEASILRANYILRALEIPKGDHKIEFKFAPKAYVVGDKITLVSNIGLVLLLLLSIGQSTRSRFKSSID